MANENTVSEKDLTELKANFKDGKLKRREFLRRAFGLGLSAAASYSLLGAVSASAQIASTRAFGEEGPTTLMAGGGEEDHLPLPQPLPPQTTTGNVGEEDATTLAIGIGEEDAHPQPRPFPNPKPPHVGTMKVGEELTTTRWGEEGTVVPPSPPRVTTFAWGEEDGVIQPSTQAWGEEGGVVQPPPATSAMVGEEGGGIQICPHTGLPIGQPQQWGGFPRW